MSQPDTTVFLHVRFPEPGQVKEQLAATIGENEATDVYTLLVEDAVSRLNPAARDGLYRLLLLAGPVNKLGRITLWLNSGEPPILEAIPQSEGTYAGNLTNAFQWGFGKLHAARVVVLAPDCPALDAAVVEQALGLLDHHDIVIGKSHDGGIYLVASGVNKPGLFTGLDEENLAASLEERGGELGLNINTDTLPVCLVVNTEADLNNIPSDHGERLQKRAAAKGFEFRTS